MSNFIKPYKISVWEDVFEDGVLKEKCLAVIGADSMDAQCRALEPTLVRNVNGTKTFTFKMYKYYIDNVTGEKVTNPFIDWLITERKVKLVYDDVWYDFIIKDITENSADYLYTYSLEDALVQELSRNGFGVTLDDALMNNIGDAEELGKSVLADTDWDVESEIFVQTIEEALVYVGLPSGASNITPLKIYRIYDQIEPYTSGVKEQLLTEEEKISMAGKTILAFYSSCKNKPNRFQFIYLDGENPYGKNADGTYRISRKDNRIINQANSQYYIVFDNPEVDYKTATASNLKDLDLLLPDGFGNGTPGIEYNISQNPIATDSQVSSWYRGLRYGYAQQSVYVPVLERYCQKFTREENIPLKKNKNIFQHGDQSDEITINATFNEVNGIVNSIDLEKKGEWVGLKLELDHHEYDTYALKYKLTVVDGILKRIGGHNDYYEPISYTIYNATGEKIEASFDTNNANDDSYVILSEDMEKGAECWVEIRYKKRVGPPNSQKDLFLQPNRGLADQDIKCTISNLSLTMIGDYLGYTDSQFVSPTLIQNCINNYNFKTTGGWYATASDQQSSDSKGKVEAVYGRFSGGDFIPIVEDFYEGSYDSENNKYEPYMKLTFKNDKQFVLNSGIRDNRTTIGMMEKDEEWVLDYKIRNSDGSYCSATENECFDFSLGEYVYNVDTGIYETRSGYFSSSASATTSPHDHCGRIIFTVDSNTYKPSEFKTESKIYLKIKPKVTIGGTERTWYIEYIALYKKVLNDKNQIIEPDYDETDSLSAKEYAKSGTIEHRYHYFNSELVKGDNAVTSADDLTTLVRTTLDYSAYKPVYNAEAKKVRTLNIKESNYFNILQNIAETFEAWLELEVKREDPDNPGAITKKIAKFKNYAGKENYANFQYGLNLKDIQRVYSSKNITTKLVVKQNNNELAKDGFCTIQRSGANPTGENYIYDFQYYQNMGIMDTEDYLQTVYYLDGAVGPDAELWQDASQVKYNGAEYESKELTEIKHNSVSNKTPFISVKPGEQIKVTYTFYASSDKSGTVLPLLHQFYSNTSERMKYCWADFDVFDLFPETGAAYKTTSTVPQTFTTTFTVPPYVRYYTAGLRATGANYGSGTGTYEGDLLFSYIKIEKIGATYPSTNLNGYFLRLKKINSAIAPINQGLIGYNKDLVQKKAKLEVAKATQEAATTGIEQTAADFQALTGLFPEESTNGKIETVSAPDAASGLSLVSPQQDWWEATGEINDDYTVTITANIKESTAICNAEPKVDQSSTLTALTSDGYKLEKKGKYKGMYLDYNFENNKKYTLEYDLTVLSDGDKYSNLTRIGGHDANNKYDENSGFQDCLIVVKDSTGKVLAKGKEGDTYVDVSGITGTVHVVYSGTYVAATKTTEDGKTEILEPNYDGEHCLWIQPNREVEDDKPVAVNVTNIKLVRHVTADENKKDQDRKANFYLNVKVGIKDKEEPISRTYDLSCTIPANQTSGTLTHTISSVDIDNSNVKKYYTEYTTFLEEEQSSSTSINTLNSGIATIETTIKAEEEKLNRLLEYKRILNKKFFEKYSRFILEGTWMSEEYVDDEKYYTDSQSVLYDSCYPQVAYTINTICLKEIPGYELLDFDLGDKTNVIDPQFFGEKQKEEVVVTEIVEQLDNPSQNSIKVQNFKNQFQDLFQKITATVQQTQYNSGSYEKGAALVDANYAKQNKWITDAINNAETYLQYGQTVTSDDSGITIVDKSDKQNKLRLVGGAILFSVEKPGSDDVTWMTGITNSGISANLITAGRLDTGAVQIMSGDKPVFRWDAYGISAYDAYWSNSGGIKTISGVNTKKFVRFDKYGIYGINDAENNDGSVWHPLDDDADRTPAQQIDDASTFSLTWEGLKVTGNNDTVAKLGKIGDKILSITRVEEVNENEKTEKVTRNLMSLDTNGILKVGDWQVDQLGLSSADNGTTTYNMRSRTLEGKKDDSPRMFLSAEGRKVKKYDEINPEKEIQPWGDDDIVFKAGENFYVTSDGALYADRGRIGDMDIGDIAVKGDMNLGRNLARKNAIEGYDYTLLEEKDYIYTIEGNKITTGLAIGTKEQNIYEAGKKYVVSYEMCIKKNASGVNKVAGHCDCFKILKIVVNGEELNTTDYAATKDNGDGTTGYVLQNYAGESIKVQLYVECRTTNGSHPGIYVQPARNVTGNHDIELLVWDVKVEEGEVATPWNIPVEDQLNSSATGSYSWVFSPSEGIKMWNGGREEGTEVFRVDSTGAYINGTIYANEGRIANWKIAEDCLVKYGVDSEGRVKDYLGSLVSGTTNVYALGNDEAFIQPGGTVGNYKIADHNQTGWAIGVGSNFGVTTAGEIYATAGRIGNMTIGDLAGRADQMVGDNLLLETNVKYTNTSYPIRSYYTSTSDFKDGDWYTISFMANLGQADASYPWNQIGIYNSGGNVSMGSIESSDISVNQDKYYSLSFQWKKTSGAHTANNSYVSIYFICGNGVSDKDHLPTSSIWNVKLEKGEVATEYCRANEEVNVNTGDFSWRFSPSQGMFMWNGAQGTISSTNPTGGAVFAIYDDNGTHKLAMKGRIEATSGQIGGWGIDYIHGTEHSHGIGILKRGDANSNGKVYTTGVAAKGDGMSVAFWAGCPNGTPWEVSNYDQLTGFFVTEDGQGKIGDCEFYQTSPPIYGTDYNITSRSYKVTDSTLRFEATITYRPYPQATGRASQIVYVDYVTSNTKDTIARTAYQWAEPTTTLTSTSPGWFDTANPSNPTKQKTTLWVRVAGYRRTDDVSVEEQLTTKVFKIYNFATYFTSLNFNNFNFGIGDGLIAGTKASILFNSNGGYLLGNWIAPDGNPVTSWRGAKYDIETLDDRYSLLFDNLQPTRFKYHYGSSGRYHTGFILDELKAAMDKAQIDSSELAAYCVYDNETGEGGIRYEELSVLNVSQIQKLKPRVSALEQTIIDYETRISTLETEIQNLKSQ